MESDTGGCARLGTSGSLIRVLHDDFLHPAKSRTRGQI